MLIPFSVNQEVVTKFNIPQHLVDWTRVKILKAIDDKRYRATRLANIDLSLESLAYLKLMELAKIANPTFDASGLVVDISPLSYCYDVSKTDLIGELNNLVSAANNYYGDTNLSNLQNFYGLIRDGRIYLAKMGVAGMNSPLELGNDLPDYAVVVTPTNITKSLVANGIVGKIIDPGIDWWNYDQTRTPAIAGKYFQKIWYKVERYINNKSYMIDTLVTCSVYSADAKDAYSIISGVTSFLDGKLPFNSTIVKAMIVESEIAANVAIGTVMRCTRDYIALSGYSSITPLPPTPAFVPNYYFDPASAGSVTYAMKSPSGDYSLVVANTLSNFSYWYNKSRVTMQNGKTYDFLVGPFAPTNQFVVQSSFKTSSGYPIKDTALPIDMVTNVTNLPYTFENKSIVGVALFNFYKYNQTQFTFPVVFPMKLTNGSYRIRNGYLFSDASTLYDLTFQQFPQSIIDKLATLASLQDSISGLIDDITKGEIFNKPSPDQTRMQSLYYDDFGVLKEFVHPVSLKPILVQNYLFELVVESAVAWDAAEKEIVPFLENLQAKNDASYNNAYQAYLRGEAVIQGGNALAVYEQKLKTGIFYNENGFDYWRPFTVAELALVEKLKANAITNQEIASQNAMIQAQNKMYQDQVNASVVKQNEEKIQLATSMAMAQVKAEVDQRLSQIVAPTMEYLIDRAEKEGGFLSDALSKWVNENPEYYFREDLRVTVGNLLNKVTDLEQKVATSLVVDKIAEVQISTALKDMFKIEGL